MVNLNTARQNPEKATNQLRFGVMVFPDASVPELVDRFRQAEAMGFDQLFLPDHIANPFAAEPAWLDGWTLASLAATSTTSIRIGTMVSNMILRPPAVLAKEAMTIDHVSGGRLELGIGAGIVEQDHQAVGEEFWTPKERVRRFTEYVEILNGVLRAERERFTFEGEWYRTWEVPTGPGPFQRPRPPLIIGGQAPTILRAAAKHADVWNTNGNPDASLEEVIESTSRQNQRLDELCREFDRDPATLRRSLIVWGAPDPLVSGISLDELVDRLAPAGITDFVLGWPEPGQEETFERLIRQPLSSLNR